MALAQPRSALPATQQARRERLIGEHAPSGAPDPVGVTPPEGGEPVAPAPAAGDPPAGESVSLSREEFNDLQGARDRSESLRVAAESSRLEAEELRQRLTELENARKEVPAPAPAAPDLGLTEADTQITEEEQETFGGSEGYIRKLVRDEVSKLLKKYDRALGGRIEKIEKTASTAATTVQRSNQKRFVDRVREKAADVDQLIQHPNFKDFLGARVPMTNMTYNTAINTAHAEEDLKAVLDIFATFRTKYNLAAPSKAGYAGAAPAGGSAGAEPVSAGSQKRYSLAERKKMSEDYKKGRISWDELEKFKLEFDRAAADDRVDP